MQLSQIHTLSMQEETLQCMPSESGIFIKDLHMQDISLIFNKLISQSYASQQHQVFYFCVV